MEQAGKIKDERIASLQRNLDDLQRNMAAIAEVLAMTPTVEQVEEALKRKRSGTLPR